MRLPAPFVAALMIAARLSAAEDPAADEKILRAIYTAALTASPAHDHLRELTAKYPGRLSGSKNLEGAVQWARDVLEKLGVDRLELQPVMVPHWERGAPERALLYPTHLNGMPQRLTVTALGNSAAISSQFPHPAVVEVKTLAELEQLGATKVAGKVVFFNRPMDPTPLNTFSAYRDAVDQRGKGPALASRLGAAAALVRSMTLAQDDVPHTGNTIFPPGIPPIPAAALSTKSADMLSAALARDPGTSVELHIYARELPVAVSHNVIGEIKGSEFPDKIILVGGHLDSWDLSPGAHDDGAGVVQSLEVLRLLKAAGCRPRHTLRVVLFTNEENGLAGATAYSTAAKEKKEIHVLALETDSGGFQPRGFNLGNPAGDAHLRAARWRPLFEPYGVHDFRAGTGGADVHPLLAHGATVAGLTPDSQRYFDYHHSATDTIDRVNPRELALGAAAMAALVCLVDRHGL